VELLPPLAQRWHLEAYAHSTARKDADPARTRADTQRSDHRQPIGQNEPKRGRRGYDGGKKVKGRKRHLLVDTNGLLIHVLVHEANIQDYHGGKLLLAPLQGCFPLMKLIWADSGYKKGGFVDGVNAPIALDLCTSVSLLFYLIFIIFSVRQRHGASWVIGKDWYPSFIRRHILYPLATSYISLCNSWA
jgi:hypothetical protein